MIVQDGLRRMLAEQEDVFFYLTVMNENYAQPAMPEGAEEGILRGMHRVSRGRRRGGSAAARARARSCARCSPARSCCATDFGVEADVWSVTSFTELRRDGMEVERRNRLHPQDEPRAPYVEQCARRARRPGRRRDRLHPRSCPT